MRSVGGGGHYWGKAECQCWNITNHLLPLLLSWRGSWKSSSVMSEAQRRDWEERGLAGEERMERTEVSSYLNCPLPASPGQQQEPSAPASTTLRQTASSLQTSWSVTLFIFGVLSFSFSLSVFQLSLTWCISLPRCWSPEKVSELNFLTTRLQCSNSNFPQSDRSRSWTRGAPSWGKNLSTLV